MLSIMSCILGLKSSSLEITCLIILIFIYKSEGPQNYDLNNLKHPAPPRTPAEAPMIPRGLQ